jgi:nitrogen fixation protein FixH
MKNTKNYWPLGVTLTLVFFFFGTIGLIVMACMQRVDLVSNNYYEEEIRYQKQIDRVEREQHLESQATAAYDPATRRVTISLPLHPTPGQVQGHIQFYRPSDADVDENYELKPDADGAQIIDASRLEQGLWRVKVSWSASGQDYYFDQKFVVQSAKL